MELPQCPNGHYYDNTKYKSCPYCVNSDSTMPNPINPGKTAPPTTPVTGPVIAPAQDEDPGITVVIGMKDLDIKPVVGWAVIIGGPDKGKDFRILAENNYIGRDAKMDICLKNDTLVSREKHALISYDKVSKRFFFSNGNGRSIIRHNNDPVFTTVELKAYDLIEVGKTQLLFIPLCGEKFDWPWEEEE